MITQKGDKWILYTRDGSRVLGTHDTREQALSQERAILMRQRTAKQAADKYAGILSQILEDVVEVHKPKYPYLNPFTSLDQLSRASRSASTSAQVRARQKTASLVDVIPHFLEALLSIRS